MSTAATSSWWCPAAFSAGDCSDLFLKRSSLRLCCRRLYEGVERFFVLGGTAFSLDSENEKDPSRLSEKVYLHPCLVSELHSSLQRSNQDSKALFVGENSISTPIVAVSVWLQCRRCGAHAYSVPDSTQSLITMYNAQLCPLTQVATNHLGCISTGPNPTLIFVSIVNR